MIKFIIFNKLKHHSNILGFIYKSAINIDFDIIINLISFDLLVKKNTMKEHYAALFEAYQKKKDAELTDLKIMVSNIAHHTENIYSFFEKIGQTATPKIKKQPARKLTAKQIMEQRKGLESLEILKKLSQS
ncbi:hypothetical protein [Pedobacter aquatilis]|uniref:hypothetical protein n=1 Tax=Pedobacter aquatilis TaxID=351343 RepID=UPI0029303781|nr:hypothetical protein [Pedobacter aquatilis]